MHNEALRDLLRRHMVDWRIIDTEVRMEVHGTLRGSSVQVVLIGFRDEVVEALQSLIASVMARRSGPTSLLEEAATFEGEH